MIRINDTVDDPHFINVNLDGSLPYKHPTMTTEKPKQYNSRNAINDIVYGKDMAETGKITGNQLSLIRVV
ncbi:hypothetical protein [Chitinophaga sp. CF118]|uniref:hypothetical protein n=1 Tax=Chitinophaga sp. CF118 TaxID=1884367 RepID=UPI001160C606|nr:hypothetical protein [Chitinophaga sp. CF118]